jgi:rfaE bifunctional protein nucleotidyltransferase chain/domain
VKKTVTLGKAILISKDLKKQNRTIILVGGCFDLLHAGHISFLNKAKSNADFLFVLLESDENIKRLKGEERPINSQTDRSIVLETLDSVDYVIALEGMTKNEDYDKLIVQIQPDYIGITKGDRNLKKREEQCNLVNAKLVEIEKIVGLSSSDFIHNIK